MNRISFWHGAFRTCALAALPFLFAASASAQAPYPQSPQIVYRGLDCGRCGPVTGYCVINVIRFEYTCAPQGTFACAGTSGTTYCRYGTMCWDGRCR
jgi:hypothetical protein